MALYRLVMKDDLGNVCHYPIVKTPMKIGRAKDNDIVLVDDTVSSHHAAIAEKGGSLGIKDLKSTNGTFVDGKRIEFPVRLRPGTEILLGACRMTVEQDDDELEPLTSSMRRPKLDP